MVRLNNRNRWCHNDIKSFYVKSQDEKGHGTHTHTHTKKRNARASSEWNFFRKQATSSGCAKVNNIWFVLLSYSGLLTPYAIDFTAAKRFVVAFLLSSSVLFFFFLAASFSRALHRTQKARQCDKCERLSLFCMRKTSAAPLQMFCCLCEFHVVRHMTMCRITQPIKLSEESHLNCSTLKPFCV